MLFKPLRTKLWDTFILPHDGRFYLFYLSLDTRVWDGYGVAISDDLVHWEDHGVVLEADDDVIGMGSGSVWRASNRWILNISYLRADVSQRIYFAESDDLLHWRKLPRAIECAPDPRWYECSADTSTTNARWDNIWAEPQEDGTFWGMVVASGKDGPAGANGVVGTVTSPDGLHWTAGPPITEPCGLVWAEVSCHFTFANRHYLLVGANACLGARVDPVYTATGKAGGMYVMMADNLHGPYRFVDDDPLLLGCRNAPAGWLYIPTYYGRVMAVDGEYLLYHHWLPRDNCVDAWLGTVKVLREEAPGRLALHYWSGNDRLTGPLLFDLAQAGEPDAPFPQARPTARCRCEDGTLTAETGATALLYYSFSAGYRDGVVIDAEMAVAGDGAAGLFFGVAGEDDNPYDGVACLYNMRGLVEFGRVLRTVTGPTFCPENAVACPVRPGDTARWRVLLRGEFIEVYCDDMLMQCFGFSAMPAKNIGFFVEQAQLTVTQLRVHAFA